MTSTIRTRTYTAILVDDEPVALDHLETLLQHFPQISVINKTTRSIELANLITVLNPDLLFLDIQMPVKNGLEVLRDLSLIPEPPRVIMVTAYDQFMLDAFRNNAFDYLLKPVNMEELAHLVARVENIGKTGSEKLKIDKFLASLPRKIQVRGVYENYFLDDKDILYLEADGKYTQFILKNQKPLLSSQNLSYYENELSAGNFLRISKSVVINGIYLYKTNRKTKTVILRAGEKEKELPYSNHYLDLNKI